MNTCRNKHIFLFSSSEAVGESSQDVVVLNGEKECEKKDGEKEEKSEEEDPHQQSFLSFLNLKPGNAYYFQTENNAHMFIQSFMMVLLFSCYGNDEYLFNCYAALL